MEHDIIDAQSYLLRQRRNRVWATMDLNSGQCAETYAENMKATMRNLASDVHFPFSLCFDESLPHEIPSERIQAKLEEAIQMDQLDQCSGNMFVDKGTSSGRKAEAASGVLTCIRPTHGIYSQKLKRFVIPSEMFQAQGMWRDDFANEDAIDKLWANSRYTQDLAGKADKTKVVVTFQSWMNQWIF